MSLGWCSDCCRTGVCDKEKSDGNLNSWVGFCVFCQLPDGLQSSGNKCNS
jgi:hypothetical protein